MNKPFILKPVFLTLAASGILSFCAYRAVKAFGKESRTEHGLPFKHQLMSHRGGSGEYVENSMPAFRYSASIRADLLELDVQATKDGKIVIFHDDTLQRMCGVSKKISDYDFVDLPLLSIPNHLCGIPAVYNDPESVQIPLLSQLFKEFPLYPMQIDVKRGSASLIIEVGNMIESLGREQMTVWGSRSNSLCEKYFGTSIPLFCSLYRTLLARSLYSIGLMKMMGFNESCIIIPNNPFLMNVGWINAMKGRGVSVIVFTLNTPDKWEEVWEKGVTGVCTDFPTRFQEWARDK